MSSMRNAVTRRPHRERSQVKSREKWGILEKHKDYSLRAQDYNIKKRKLAQLSEKARERNPDEFAFGMLSSGTAKQGKHGAKGSDNVLSHDAVKLLKTQDAGYLKTVDSMGRKEIEKLRQEVAMGLAMGPTDASNKIVFTDNERSVDKEPSAQQAIDEDLVEVPGDDGSVEDTQPKVSHLENRAIHKPKSKKAIQAKQDAAARLLAERKRRKRLQEMRVAKLEVLKKRQKEILAATDQLELQRAKMANTAGGVNKQGIKFQVRERKK